MVPQDGFNFFIVMNYLLTEDTMFHNDLHFHEINVCQRTKKVRILKFFDS